MGRNETRVGVVVVMGTVLRAVWGRVRRSGVRPSRFDCRVHAEAARWYSETGRGDGVMVPLGVLVESVESGFPGGWAGFREAVRAW